MHCPAPSPSPGLITPFSSAPIAVIGLNVDPVGYVPLTARSVSGAGDSAEDPAVWALPSSAANWASVSGLANALGSKLGEDPIASISPLRGSIATNAPAVAGLPL